MKTQLKVLSVLAAALAVVFSTASVSMAFSAPDEMANCREVDSGLSFECDPVSNLVVVNSGVIPVTGLAFPSSATSLRSINELTSSPNDLTLSDFSLVLPFLPDLDLTDFALANPSAPATSLRGVNDFVSGMPATSLRAVNEVALGASGLSLSDFALTLPVVPVLSLSDFASSSAGLENLSLSDFAISAIGLDSISLSDFAFTLQDRLIQDDNAYLMDDFYFGGQYESGLY